MTKRLFVQILVIIILIIGFSRSNGVINFENPAIVEKRLIRGSNHNVIEETPFRHKITTPSKILRIGERYRPPNYDPLTVTIGANYKRNSLLFDGLTEYDSETSEVVPSLASQWTVSLDSKSWTFDLREDVTFHDGSRFNASSVEFNFDRIIDPNHIAYFPLESLPLESTEIISEFRIKFNFKEPYAPFTNLDAIFLKIISPNSFNESGNMIDPIGTGPYILNRYTSDDYFQNFTRFSDYYKGLPPFEQIHYYNFGDSPPNLWNNFEDNITSQDIDFTGSTILLEMSSSSSIEEIFIDDYWQIVVLDDISTHGVFHINHKNPVLSNHKVRQALNYAINRTDLIKSYYSDTATPMKNLLPAGTPCVDNSIPGYPYDITLANNLLDEAGYPIELDGYRFDLQLLGTSISEPMLNQIAPYFENIGINASVYIPTDFGTHFNTGNYDLLVIGYLVQKDPFELWYYLHPESPSNTGGYSNETIAELLRLGGSTPVKQEREYYYNQIQWLVQEEAPYIYLSNRKKFFAASKTVAPFVFLNKMSEFNFKFSEPLLKLSILDIEQLGQDTNIYNMKDVDIHSTPIYFPFTDAVISSNDQQSLTISMKMTHQIKNLISSQDMTGKYYKIIPDSNGTSYNFRAYYNLWEIGNSPVDDLTIFHWDSSTESWIEPVPVSNNKTFRYIEAGLTGNLIVKIGPVLSNLTETTKTSTGTTKTSTGTTETSTETKTKEDQITSLETPIFMLSLILITLLGLKKKRSN